MANSSSSDDTITIDSEGTVHNTVEGTIRSRKSVPPVQEPTSFYHSSHPAHPALWVLTWLVLGAASSYSIFQWHKTKQLLQHYEARLEAIEGKTDELPLYVNGIRTPRDTGGTPEFAQSEVSGMLDQVRRAQEGAQHEPAGTMDQEYEKLALQAQLFDVGDRLEQLEQKLSTAVTQSFRENKQLVALIELHRGIRSGKPFPLEVNNLISAADDDGLIISNANILVRYAEKGIRDRKALYERFSGMARDIVIAHHKEAADNSFVERFKANMSQVVTVRRVGENLAGDEVDAIVGRAEVAVQQDDVERAVYELSKLEGKASEVATPWLDDAKALLTAEDVLNTLFRHIAKKQEKTEASLPKTVEEMPAVIPTVTESQEKPQEKLQQKPLEKSQEKVVETPAVPAEENKALPPLVEDESPVDTPVGVQ
jgi:hypothetical protein